MMLTQGESDEEQGGEEGREEEANEGEEREAAEGEEDDDDDGDDDDDSEGYESSEDPFPCEPRQRPMDDELDKDFDPQGEIGIKP
jgi:hypothetical protein